MPLPANRVTVGAGCTRSSGPTASDASTTGTHGSLGANRYQAQLHLLMRAAVQPGVPSEEGGQGWEVLAGGGVREAQAERLRASRRDCCEAPRDGFCEWFMVVSGAGLTVVDGLNVGVRQARRSPIAMVGSRRWMNCRLRR